MERIRRIGRHILNVAMTLGSGLMLVGLLTGWTIAEFHSAVGMPVSAYPPATKLWDIGLTLLLLGLAGRELGRR